MKRCPNCDKTFADGMKFCQTDGTLLVDDAPPEDPYKTVVGNQSDIAAAIPPLDPFKTMVASPPPKFDDDILDLPPEEPDAMKTMVVSQDELNAELNAVKADAPPSLGGKVPIIEPKPAGSSSNPPPPKFNDSPFSPPSFGDSGQPSNISDSGDEATAIMNSLPEDISSKLDSKKLDSKTSSNDFSTKSPYGNQDNKPIPSPFDLSMPPGYMPSSPFDAPKSKVKEPEPIFNATQEPPPSQSPFGQTPSFNDPQPFNEPLGQAEWTPPPAPVAEWQNQDLGANTPFQPPPAGQGLNQTLPIVSLVLGIISLCCFVSPLTGLGALITGYLGMKNANQDPNQYGGKGLAIAGMIVGGIFFVLGVVYWILNLLGLAANLATMGR